MLPWVVLRYLATVLLLAYLGLMLVHGLRVTAGLLLATFSFVAHLNLVNTRVIAPRTLPPCR